MPTMPQNNLSVSNVAMNVDNPPTDAGSAATNTDTTTNTNKVVGDPPNIAPTPDDTTPDNAATNVDTAATDVDEEMSSVNDAIAHADIWELSQNPNFRALGKRYIERTWQLQSGILGSSSGHRPRNL